jgi:hypothetical protein
MCYTRTKADRIIGTVEEQIERICKMEDDIKRRMVYGVLSLILSSLAAWLASYLTNKLLGDPEEK